MCVFTKSECFFNEYKLLIINCLYAKFYKIMQIENMIFNLHDFYAF